MREFTFYVEITSNGCVPNKTWERLKVYVALLKDHMVSFVWMYGNLEISHKSILSILRFEKKECVHKGIIVRNIVISRQKKKGIMATCLMKKYNFVYKKDITEDRKTDITRMCFGNSPISCIYNSCLGSIIVLLSNGELKACPIINCEISLNDRLDIQNIQEVFNTDSFIKLLKDNIEKRNKCKNDCLYFPLCKGGCALEEISGECRIFSAIEKQRKKKNKYDMNNHVYREQRIIEVSNRYKV